MHVVAALQFACIRTSIVDAGCIQLMKLILIVVKHILIQDTHARSAKMDTVSLVNVLKNANKI